MSKLLIMLHGVGSDGDSIAPYGHAIARAIHARAISPDAPERYDQAATGRQWFSVSGVTAANRPARVAAARAGFDATLSAIITDQGFENRLDHVILAGFSQGAIMALDAVASGRWPVAAVVAFSLRLASPLPLTPAPHTPVLLIHGTADPVMPIAEATSAEASLTAAGIATTLHLLPGVGHAIPPEGLALAQDFLRKHLR